MQLLLFLSVVFYSCIYVCINDNGYYNKKGHFPRLTLFVIVLNSIASPTLFVRSLNEVENEKRGPERHGDNRNSAELPHQGVSLKVPFMVPFGLYSLIRISVAENGN